MAQNQMVLSSNSYSVLEIINMIDRKELIVNSDYQRGSGLWPDGPSSYFIDTILNGYPFPKIYMYEFLDRSNRGIKREIVDGQQRIKTIIRFYQNELVLTGDTEFAGSKFRDLDEAQQATFLTYPVAVDVIRHASHAQILEMFRRMNAFTLPLNEAEKRHSSFQGKFKWFVNHLAQSQNEFFLEFGVFTNRQIIRMADAELISEFVVTLERGIISSSPSDLRSLYLAYDDEFSFADAYRSKIESSIQFIIDNFGDLRRTFMMKPYALHSLVTALLHCRFGIPQVQEIWGVKSPGVYPRDVGRSVDGLLALAHAHETKDMSPQFSKYVWGCLAGTNRAPRRVARVAAVMRVLGLQVPGEVDGKLPQI